MAERKPTVDIIATVGKKIMFLKQEQPRRSLFSSLPAGKIEKNENPKTTVLRELLEETGYKPSKVIFFDEYFGDSKTYFHEYIYIAKNCKKVAEQKLDSGEKIQVKLVSFKAFLNLCREKRSAISKDLKFEMYEALVNKKEKKELRKKIFG